MLLCRNEAGDAEKRNSFSILSCLTFILLVSNTKNLFVFAINMVLVGEGALLDNATGLREIESTGVTATTADVGTSDDLM